jgi:hypothetical protein
MLDLFLRSAHIQVYKNKMQVEYKLDTKKPFAEFIICAIDLDKGSKKSLSNNEVING